MAWREGKRGGQDGKDVRVRGSKERSSHCSRKDTELSRSTIKKRATHSVCVQSRRLPKFTGKVGHVLTEFNVFNDSFSTSCFNYIDSKGRIIVK
jgi:hypothetical protein